MIRESGLKRSQGPILPPSHSFSVKEAVIRESGLKRLAAGCFGLAAFFAVKEAVIRESGLKRAPVFTSFLIHGRVSKRP